MANILSKNLQGLSQTPILLTELNLASSLQGEAELAIDKIIVHTDKTLRKEGSRFFIDNEEIDLELLNVLDLLILLRNKGISVGFLNNNDYWYYPALCILDFSNIEYSEISMSHTPFDLVPYNQIKSLSITPLEQTTLIVSDVLSSTTKTGVPFKRHENMLVVGKLFQPYDLTIMVKVFSKKFMLKLDNKFTTDKIDTVARYLKEIPLND